MSRHARELDVSVGQDPVVEASRRGRLDLETRPPRHRPVLPDPDWIFSARADAKVVDLPAGELRGKAGDDLEDDISDLLLLDAFEPTEGVEETRPNGVVRQRTIVLLAGQRSGSPLGEL